MKIFTCLLILLYITACKSTPSLEEDPRYAKLATVVSKREFSALEREQARQSTNSSNVHIGIGFGMGFGSHDSFGGMLMGMDDRDEDRKQQPQIARGAIRYTVRPQGSQEKFEVMSYKHYKVGDCVKVLTSPPAEFPRLLELKNDEHCAGYR